MRFISKLTGLLLLAATLVGIQASVAHAASLLNSGAVRSGITGKCLDISGSNPANGTSVQLYDCNGQSWTQWDDGTLQNLGKCLQTVNGGVTNYTQVEISDCNAGPSQVWQPYNNGYLNPASGLCLDDPGATSANNTRLQLYSCNGTNAQVWTIPGGRLGSSAGFGAMGPIYATSYNGQSGTGRSTTPAGFTYVGWISNGDWLEFDNVNFFANPMSHVMIDAAQWMSGSTEVHIDSLNNAPVATMSGPLTPNSDAYGSQSATLSRGISGYHTVYLRFTTTTGKDFINVQWLSFSS